jgi:hypothetical protein
VKRPNPEPESIDAAALYMTFRYTLVHDCEGADLNDDGMVGQSDLAILLAEFGCASSCTADLDCDGKVGQSDLGILLAHFGRRCGE